MPSLREIRRKIKSVRSTEQITKAMKMVAAARMRRSQAAILSARPFAIKMEELVHTLAELEIQSDLVAGRAVRIHEFLDERPAGPTLLVLVAGDKGLCGAFNTNLIRAALGWLRERPSERVYLSVVGRKARDFAHKLRGFDAPVLDEMIGIFPKVSFTHAEILGKGVMDAYREKGLKQVVVLYNEFKSVAQQRLIDVQLLPIAPVGRASGKARPGFCEYGFEPDRQVLLGALLPRFVKAELYRILLESQAAELAARMNAMDAASKNAKDLREALNLNLNRQRQAIITKEIAELVGGAEALAA